MPATPKGAKQPQDHKVAKADAQRLDVTVEYSGVTYTIEADAFNDVELLEWITDMQDGQPHLIAVIVRKALGPTQWAQFKESNRDKDGRISGEHAGNLFELIDEALGNLPASSGS